MVTRYSLGKEDHYLKKKKNHLKCLISKSDGKIRVKNPLQLKVIFFFNNIDFYFVVAQKTGCELEQKHNLLLDGQQNKPL